MIVGLEMTHDSFFICDGNVYPIMPLHPYPRAMAFSSLFRRLIALALFVACRSPNPESCMA